MTYVDSWTQSDTLRRRLRRLTKAERTEEATEFLRLYHHENGLPPAALADRLRDVVGALRQQSTYVHTVDELAYGARVAWRNHASCIGRLFWKSLDVVDARHLVDPDAVAGCLAKQLAAAGECGNSRPTIVIFAPAGGDTPPVWIENRQAVQYAGYISANAGVVGDPASVEFTRSAIALGWRPPEPQTQFDVLPLVIRDASGRRRVYTLPAASVHEVDITHPTAVGLAGLGLKWYAVPCVCDMILTIGGIEYPCAPFIGFYMATEIASRNLIDEMRYDALDMVATALDIRRSDILWKDLALVELNRAVLHSFGEAGFAIVDHHTASRQYLDFVRLEQAAERVPSGRWDWIVPPQASAACPVFHLPMTDHGDVPNFYRTRALDGDRLHPARLAEQRGPTLRRLDRAKRRLRRWLRTRG